jgi:glutamate mutase epsilon subunit
VVPVSSGESISIASASTAQELSADYLNSFLSTLFPQIEGGFPQVMAVIHGIIHSSSTRHLG